VDDLLPLNQRTYVRLTVKCLWDNLPLVLLAGVIFSLLCAPMVLLLILGLFAPAIMIGMLTIAPAWAALLAQESEIARGVKTSIRTMVSALPRFWARSTGLGFLLWLQGAIALLTLAMLSRPEVSPVVWLGLAADMLGLLLLIVLYLYAFPLLVQHDMALWTALRNAFILASRHLNNTLGLLGMGILFALAILYLSSGLLLFLPAVWGMFIVNNCRLVVGEEMDKDVA
jgi:uncharacterized membrane protein YesL